MHFTQRRWGCTDLVISAVLSKGKLENVGLSDPRVQVPPTALCHKFCLVSPRQVSLPRLHDEIGVGKLFLDRVS